MKTPAGSIACALFLSALGWPIDALAALPYGAFGEDQSAFALGSITLNVVFVESDGSIDPNQEDWTPQQLELLRGEISAAAEFWTSQTDGFHPNARLSFNVDFVNGGVPVTTGYEPISRPGNGSGAWPWITDTMQSLGYSGNRLASVRQFNNVQRFETGTHWATTMFVVNDFVDEDNTFSDGAFAFSLIGGPYIVTTYDNGRWGIDRFNQILAHELGHTFFALDEYAASRIRNTASSGYLNGINGNAERDGTGRVIAPPQPNALMLDATLDASPWTKVQVGHLDTDVDGIPDILDTFPTLIGSDDPSDPDAGVFVFSGGTGVSPIPNENLSLLSNSQSPMTINWIESAAYNLNDTGWIDFNAADGEYGDYTETLSLTLAGLTAGEHLIDVRVENSVGNLSEPLRFAFTSTVPEPTTLVMATAGMGLLAITFGCRCPREVRP